MSATRENKKVTQKPLPTTPGYYSSGTDAHVIGILQLTVRGVWYWIGNKYAPNPCEMDHAAVHRHGPLTLVCRTPAL